MNRIRWYGPTIALSVALLVVMIAGPGLMRRLAWAHTDEQIKLIKDGLDHNPTLAELSSAFRKVAQVVEPSVVHIQVFSRQPRTMSTRSIDPDELRRFFFGPGSPFNDERIKPDPKNEQPAPDRKDGDLEKYDVPHPTGTGSGWVFDARGYIITNNHVVDGADRIVVRFVNGSERQATVVGTDPKTDVAVIKVDGDSLHPASRAEDPVEQGDIVFAFGSPLGNEFSMSQGIISGKGRQVGILREARGYENFIQTDASINPGNSGGPLTNIYGQVVGMNTAIATRTGFYNGIGYAIPVRMVANVAQQIIQNGKVSRGYLGIVIDQLDEKMARTFGFDGHGVLVRYPVTDSPAQKAGIARGDIITRIDGNAVADPDELRNMVAAMPPGTEVKVDLFREGKTLTRTVTLAQLPDKIADAALPRPGAAPGQAEPTSDELLRKIGLDSVSEFSKQQAESFQLKFTPGVLIRDVRVNSVAWAKGLRPNMIITHVMNTPVTSPKALVEQLKKHDLKEGVRISVMAGDQPIYVLLELSEG